AGEEAGGLEAGAHDEHVDVVVGAAGVDQPGFGDRGDRVGDEFDVGLVECGVEGGGQDGAFAAPGVVGGDCGAGGGVGDGALDVVEAGLAFAALGAAGG